MVKTKLELLEGLRDHVAGGLLQVELELEVFKPKLVLAIHPQMEQAMRQKIRELESILENNRKMIELLDKRIGEVKVSETKK